MKLIKIEISPKLDELTKFFKFGKDKIKNEIKESLIEVDNNTSSFKKVKGKLESDIAQLSTQINKYILLLQKAKEEYNIKLKDFSRVKATQNELIAELSLENRLVKNDFKDKTNKLNNLKEKYQLQFNELNDLKEKYNTINKNLKSLNKEYLAITNKLNFLMNKFNEVSNKFDLVSELLSVSPEHNEALQKFKKLLYGEFMDFANEEASLAEEAEAILILQRVEKELELIVGFSTIYSKNIIAIGGGFSSGKSAFVSSFFDKNNIKLPVGIEPVTAIPTYVISDAKDIIKGFF